MSCSVTSFGRLSPVRAAVSSGYDDAVQRNLLARLGDDDAAGRDVIRCYPVQFSTGIFQIGVVGTDIHQRCDGFAAPDYGHILKQLSGLIEQHDRDRFRVFADGKCADGRDRHQKVLVEDFAVQDVADCPEKDVGTDDEIGCRAQGDVQGR